jgi:hypothetical protein
MFAVQVHANTAPAEALAKRMRKLRDLSITLGYQGASGQREYMSGINVASVAAYQEFGTVTIPARAFLRRTAFERGDEIGSLMAKAIEAVIAGADPVDALAARGADLVDLFRRTIQAADSWAKPLAESTVAKKGHDTILIDTALMLRSLSWAVRRGDLILKEGT